jgi:UDP-glucose 4-epimerase
MNILIIGSEGSIGREICKTYKKKHKIYKIDKIKKNEKNYYTVDLSKKRVKKIIFKVNIDLVIFLSFNLNFKYYDNKKYISEGKNILENSLSIIKLNKIKKIQYFSSFAVYGNNEKINIENLKVSPVTSYGKLKLFFEKKLISYSSINDINLQIFRIPNVYGRNFKSSVIYKFKFLTKNKQNVILNNNGNAIRNFIHINDLCSLSIKASKVTISGIYNATFNKNYKIIEIAKKMNCKIKFNPKKFKEPKIIQGNSKKAFNDFDWKAKIDIIKIKNL